MECDATLGSDSWDRSLKICDLCGSLTLRCGCSWAIFLLGIDEIASG